MGQNVCAMTLEYADIPAIKDMITDHSDDVKSTQGFMQRDSHWSKMRLLNFKRVIEQTHCVSLKSS